MTLAGLALETVCLIAEVLIDVIGTFESLGCSKLLLVP